MSDDFDLNTHPRKTKLIYTNAGQDGAVVRHPLFEISNRGHHGLFAEVCKVEPDLVDLGPCLTTSVLQSVFDVGEGLVNLLVEVGGDFTGLRVPATLDHGQS
jgi:hypothetical protein